MLPNFEIQDCWSYQIKINAWENFATSVHQHIRKPANFYDNKLFIVDDANAEFYDFETATWHLWPNVPNPIGVASCSVVWKDTLVVVGGTGGTGITGGISETGIQMFNFTSRVWTRLSDLASRLAAPGNIIVFKVLL